MNEPFNILWLQSGGCGGCTMSVLNAESPDFLRRLEINNINLMWHPSLSDFGGRTLLSMLDDIASGKRRLDALCLEGAVMCGPDGTGRYHLLAGTDTSMMQWIRRLSEKAKYTIAIGSCAAFGGISASGGNPTDARGLQHRDEHRLSLLPSDWQSPGGLPVINIAGCPTHPDWVTDTLAQLAAGELTQADLDSINRPRSYTDHLVHHGCPRNEFYEYKASAEAHAHQGCMMEHLGCLGTQARADCNRRTWNGEGSCIRGGYACINCTAPGFEDPGHAFTETPKIAGIPVGLPTDMPKAWFVALASLSKAATPRRLRVNAVSDYLVCSPGDQPGDMADRNPEAKAVRGKPARRLKK